MAIDKDMRESIDIDFDKITLTKNEDDTYKIEVDSLRQSGENQAFRLVAQRAEISLSINILGVKDTKEMWEIKYDI